LCNTGYVAMGLLGDLSAAAAAFDELIAFGRQRGNAWAVTLGLIHRGQVAVALEDRARAVACHREGLDLVAPLGDRVAAAHFAEFLGWLAGAQRPERATRLLGAGEALREAVGTPLSD